MLSECLSPFTCSINTNALTQSALKKTKETKQLLEGRKYTLRRTSRTLSVFLSSVGLIDLPFAVIAFHTWKEIFSFWYPNTLRAAESICLKFDLRHFFLLHT
ncbi:MAG: hypothetical protein DWH94_11240 [Planctomycetota bacterium]|nr:MAG: hypothetical protein DWH94_11240 [Planctomycetota bacterium]